MSVRAYQIAVCDDCMNSIGDCCHEPDCVFCRQSVSDSSKILDAIFPFIRGGDFSPVRISCDDENAEYQVMAERLIELEEIRRSDESGQLYWRGSGERLI